MNKTFFPDAGEEEVSEITQAVQLNNRAWLNQRANRSISMNQVCTIRNQARIM